MNQNYYLCSPWCVWLNYQVPEELANKVNYNDYLKKVHTITTYNDLAYYLQESRFKDLHDFLVTEGENNTNLQSMEYPAYFRFEIENDSKNISAINYFREGINPTWEDENNKFGGRLIFQIDKNIEQYQEIYEWLLFYFFGESESCAEDINGIRFISHKSNAPFKFHHRVEVWTKFNSEVEESKMKLFRDTFVKDFFNSFLTKNDNIKNFKPSFKNNEEKEKKPQEGEKDRKEGQ